MIRLLIVDGFPVVRAGLRTILASSPDIQIVGEAQDGSEAVDRTLELLPDVLLMELRLPNTDGLTALRTLHTRAPQAKVLLFTASENKEDFIEAMKLGCCGISCPKTRRPRSLPRASRRCTLARSGSIRTPPPQ